MNWDFKKSKEALINYYGVTQDVKNFFFCGLDYCNSCYNNLKNNKLREDIKRYGGKLEILKVRKYITKQKTILDTPIKYTRINKNIEKKDIIKCMIKDGKTYTAIGENLGITHQRVQPIAKELGIKKYNKLHN